MTSGILSTITFATIVLLMTSCSSGLATKAELDSQKEKRVHSWVKYADRKH